MSHITTDHPPRAASAAGTGRSRTHSQRTVGIETSERLTRAGGEEDGARSPASVVRGAVVTGTKHPVGAQEGIFRLSPTSREA
jgi:hypothetical protein